MNNRIEERIAEFEKWFVKDNGLDVEPSFLDPNGSVGPVMDWLRTTLTTIAEEARLGGFADGYKQGRFDAEMDRLNSEEPASNNK